MNVLRFSFIIVLYIVFALPIYSIEPKSQLTVFGGYSAFDNFSDFKNVPNVPNCCNNFDSGIGDGFLVGLKLRKALLTHNLFYFFNIQYSYQSNEFLAYEDTYIYFNDDLTQGQFEHRFETYYGQLGLMPGLEYNLLGINLGIGLGISSNIKRDYYQIEKISKPSDAGTFLDEFGNDTGLRTRNQFSGTLASSPDVALSLSLHIGYDLPLSPDGKWIISPFIIGSRSINKVSNQLNWLQNSISLGIGLTLAPDFLNPIELVIKDSIILESNEIAADQSPIDKSSLIITDRELAINENDTKDELIFEYDTTKTTTIEKRVFKIIEKDTVEIINKLVKLSLNVTPIGLNTENINSITQAIIRKSKISSPILNYIFFDENSTQIPKRYKERTADIKNELSEYYNQINRLGAIAQKSNSDILLNSLQSPSEIPTAALERAEAIKSHLVNNYGIDPGRISVRISPVKTIIANNDLKSIDELRRVEIISDDLEVYNSEIKESSKVFLNSEFFKVEYSIDSEIKPKQIQLECLCDNEVIGSINLPVSHKNELKLYIEKYLNNIELPVDCSTLQFALNAISIDNSMYRTKNINFAQINSEPDGSLDRTDKYNLILFDNNSSELNLMNKQFLDRLKKIIPENANIEIRGFTDDNGNSSFNMKLSHDRALEVKKYLGIKNSKTSGLGDSVILYDNSLPEGRIYNRSVEILVKKLPK